MAENDLIRAARIAIGWSQDELAERAHTVRSTVSRYESGVRPVGRGRMFAMRAALEAAGVIFLADGLILPKEFRRPEDLDGR